MESGVEGSARANALALRASTDEAGTRRLSPGYPELVTRRREESEASAACDLGSLIARLLASSRLERMRMAYRSRAEDNRVRSRRPAFASFAASRDQFETAEFGCGVRDFSGLVFGCADIGRSLRPDLVDDSIFQSSHAHRPKISQKVP